MSTMPTPQEAAALIDSIDASHRALEEQLAGLTDEQARAASPLPGWSRAHVVTHLARHADATTRMARGARERRPAEQYAGGAQGRAAEIEAGAGRDAASLLADLSVADARCVETLRSVDDQGWEHGLEWSGTTYPATRALVSRWREVEIHRVDLDLGGFGPQDWSGSFVAYFLPGELERLPERAASVEVPRGLADHEMLAWLVGRGDPSLPELPAWA